MNITPPAQPLIVDIGDVGVTDEAVAIALGHLYAPFSYSMLNPSNSRAVLLAASHFGLTDLCNYAYSCCKSFINSENIVSWVDWCEAQENKSSASRRDSQGLGMGGSEGYGKYINGSLASAMGLPSPAGSSRDGSVGNGERSGGGKKGGWAQSGKEQIEEGDWVARLKQDIKNYLIYHLAPELSSRQPTPQSATTNPTFINIFTLLPFDLFKFLIENGEIAALGQDQERFAFAKKLILGRRKKALSQIQAVNKDMTQKEAAGQVPVENVVLSFGGNSGSSVHVTRKVPARALWKVEKDR